MPDSDKNLQAFINKMLQLQNEQREKPLSESDLKEIAMEIGMTEEDWALSEQAFEGHLQSGKSHLDLRNWNDALYELQQAQALRPQHLDVLMYLSETHKEIWAYEKDDTHREKALSFANQALRVRPAYPPAINLLKNIQSLAKQSKANRSRVRIFAGAILGGVLLIFGLVYYSFYNTIITKQEEVNKKWAQVENVYQRRSDLVPQLVSTVKAQSKMNRENLDKLLQLHGKVNQEASMDPESFQTAQAELSSTLKAVRSQIAEDPSLMNSGAYRDLKVQIEGSENRIAVERKRYDEAVAEYNRYIKRFPQNLLGFKEKSYFKIDKSALENPDISLD